MHNINREDKLIDITFDLRTDSNNGDPDAYSETLNKYHKYLWNKCLPNGSAFSINNIIKEYGKYYLKSETYRVSLFSSDIMNTGYIHWKSRRNMGKIINEMPKNEIENFSKITHSIGNFIIFPSKQIDGKPTINKVRGYNNSYIEDRFDLTLECIKLFFSNINNPLYNTLKRYNDFFRLFVDFKGYCTFFLLDDLVYDSFKKINYHLPFNDFSVNPCPANIDEYSIFMNNSIEFIKKRNIRMKEFFKKNK